MLSTDPFRDLDRLSEQLLGASAGSGRTPRFMPVDLYRCDDHFVVHADLPGVDPGSIDVQVDGGVLSITAQRTARADDAVQWISSERFSGSYRRQFTLGDGVDPEGISATYENGVVTLSIPIAERAKPRKIEIATASPGQQAIETTAAS